MSICNILLQILNMIIARHNLLCIPFSKSRVSQVKLIYHGAISTSQNMGRAYVE